MRSHRRLWGDVHARVSLTGGPSYSRDADESDPPYTEPAIRLGFTAHPRHEAEPLLWEGDDA